MDSLLLEIGTEEIPAGYIQPALEALAEQLQQKMAARRIVHGAITTYGTPRRLVATVEAVASRQTAITEQVLGPPQRVAFDDHGQPTMAAIKFAEKVGLMPNMLKIVATEKGQYIAAVVTDKGTSSKNVLQQILPEVILSIPFPKSMRWADTTIAFARPIHNILALLGDKLISFTIDTKIKSNRYTNGHMFMHPKRVKVPEAGQYLAMLRQGQVIAAIAERKAMVEEQTQAVAESLGGRILPDPDLVDTVTNLVEIPVAVGGRFDEVFLELPREILITAMREHQKYFAVIDENGHLLPCFVAVNNTRCKDAKLASKGHERVLRARLADARFFYNADCRQSVDQWREQLKGVLFQAKLGSMYDKCQRVEQLGAFIAENVAPELSKQVVRAAQICKADLVSQVVNEFPKLQGVMGRHYAARAGETPDVAAAVEEHYRPTYSGGPLPDTLTGALLAVADKLDTISGCFSAGLQPTGASDPYALRRQCIGVAHIMLKYHLSFSMKSAIAQSLKAYGQNLDQTAGAVYQFLGNRISHMLAEQGFDKDIIAAVTSVSVDHIPYVWQRTEALQQLKGDPDFEPLAVAFKRVVNILRKAEDAYSNSPDAALFEDPCEKSLFEAVISVRKQVDQLLANEELLPALQAIASLRPPVDEFFDGVMVMCDKADVRRNRLSLLNSIAALFDRIADFSKIGA